MTTTQIRTALRQIPKGSATSVGAPPRPDEIYALPEHAAAIDPDVSLVVGNRGMGKTFWATALEQEDSRREIAERFLGTRGTALRNLDVLFGFADGEGTKGLSRDAIDRYCSEPPEALWRGLLVVLLSQLAGKRPIAFKDAVQMAKLDPDSARELFRAADDHLARRKRRCLVLFDQLDRLPGDWGGIQRLTRGLLRVALAMKSYKAIRLKIFMRSDQEADDSLFDFPDASKIRGEQARLGWQAKNLYGLLYHTLWSSEAPRNDLVKIMRSLRLSDRSANLEYGIPYSLAANDAVQGAVFDRIAGTMMGGGSKRGRPYTWIPTHLADGRLEISPRSFLTACRVAAEHPPRTNPNLAFDYYGIQAGVSEASKNRLTELREDYPWISDALDPLHGLAVPAEQSVVRERWEANETYVRILSNHKDRKAPIELVIAEQRGRRFQSEALERALVQIGVFEPRADGRINVPDIFRIDAGIKRRGGITPQQRRRI